MRVFCFVIGLLFAVTMPSLAQLNFNGAKTSSQVVTILSDGISEPNGLASEVLNEISVTLDKANKLRVLSINGYGGPTNIRDLIQLRGADFAIVNNDVLAYLDLTKALPDARQKVRMVSPLFHQAVFLFARQGIESIKSFEGKKLGVLSRHPSRAVTAKTVLGLLKINASVVELDDRTFAQRATSDLDGVLVFEKDLSELNALGVTSGVFHLVPIPNDGPIAKVYLPRKISKAGLAGFSADDIQTVQVTALLASFDWNAKTSRFLDVTAFVKQFFLAVPELRQRYPNSPLAKTDLKVQQPGWQRFAPATSYAAATPAPSPANDLLPLISSVAAPKKGDVLHVEVVSRPPLTSQQREDGGVALKLFSDALAKAGIPISVQWVESEKTLLEDLIGANGADIGLFWQTSNCEEPNNLSINEATLCDRVILSAPIMQVVLGVYTRLDTTLSKDNSDPSQRRVVCVPENQSITTMTLNSMAWLKSGSVKMLRPKTLIDCVIALQRGDADAMIAVEAEARFVIDRLMLSATFQLAQHVTTPIGLHAMVAKDNVHESELLESINAALTKFKISDAYSAVIASHMTDLTGPIITSGKP